MVEASADGVSVAHCNREACAARAKDEHVRSGQGTVAAGVANGFGCGIFVSTSTRSTKIKPAK
jgi:hypothetical protein